ncbi:MAG: DUF202 domain-containing protein [Streptomycetales bacterium]
MKGPVRRPREPGPDLDEQGLQSERTSLAWVRTALALGVAALLGARLAHERAPLAAVVVALLGLAGAMLLMGLSERSVPGLDGDADARADASADADAEHGPSLWRLLVLCGCVMVFGAAALVLIALPGR